MGALSDGVLLPWVQKKKKKKKKPFFVVNHREAEIAHGMELFCASLCKKQCYVKFGRYRRGSHV